MKYNESFVVVDLIEDVYKCMTWDNESEVYIPRKFLVAYGIGINDHFDCKVCENGDIFLETIEIFEDGMMY